MLAILKKSIPTNVLSFFCQGFSLPSKKIIKPLKAAEKNYVAFLKMLPFLLIDLKCCLVYRPTDPMSIYCIRCRQRHERNSGCEGKNPSVYKWPQSSQESIIYYIWSQWVRNNEENWENLSVLQHERARVTHDLEMVIAFSHEIECVLIISK
jgi:hypothetical protein